jgi:hypothetical protein
MSTNVSLQVSKNVKITWGEIWAVGVDVEALPNEISVAYAGAHCHEEG